MDVITYLLERITEMPCTVFPMPYMEASERSRKANHA